MHTLGRPGSLVRSRRVLPVAALGILLSGCGALGTPFQAADHGALGAKNAPRPWSYMLLAAHDNNQGPAAAIGEAFERAKALGGVAPVAIVDESGADDSVRYSIGPAGVAKDKLPEADSAGPKAIADLLGFALQSAPAQRRVMTISGHGGGILRGMLTDEHGSATKVMPVNQVALGLRSQPVDVLFLDACFMQTIEVAYELQPVAEVVIGSESETFAGAVPHAQLMQQLSETTGTVPADAVAQRLVQAAGGAYMPDSTLSAIRVRRMGTLLAGLARLSNDLTFALRANPNLKATVRQAMANSQGYLGATDQRLVAYNGYRDLGDLLANIGAAAGGDIQKQVHTILADLHTNVVAARAQGGRYGRSTGLAIYAPAGGEVAQSYFNSAFSMYTRWGDFLAAVNSNAAWHNPVVQDRFPAAFPSRVRLGASAAGQAPVYEVPGYQPPANGGIPGYPGVNPGYPSPGYPSPGYPNPGYPAPGYPR